MKTINLKTMTATDAPDARDDIYKPQKTFHRSPFILQADGIHCFYQLGDNKTTGHAFIPSAQLWSVFEQIDGNFKVPVANPPANANNKQSQ